MTKLLTEFCVNAEEMVMSLPIELRHATPCERDEVAELIYLSTNVWYRTQGKAAVFQGEPLSTRLFCDVYEDLDPGCCLVAEVFGRIVGSCFYHPRETHVSLGIMNVHPSYAGRGVAHRLLQVVIDTARQQDKPVRLVSSAMNLDSFSLYTRAGLAPYALYQDMLITVPDTGIPKHLPTGKRMRDATPQDVGAMVALETNVLGVSRASDFEYFIRNQAGYWHMSVIENSEGQLDGFLASIHHAASPMLGPGCMRSDDDAFALICRELDTRRGCTMVWLVPSNRPALTTRLYALGARNCELHVGQSTGIPPCITGVVMPTFMPETA